MTSTMMPSFLRSIWDLIVVYIVTLLVSLGILGQKSPLWIKVQSKKYPYQFAEQKSDPSEKIQCVEKCLLSGGENPDDDSVNTSQAINLWELRELALSRGGFVNAKYRQIAWPKLVGISSLPVKDVEKIPDLTRATTDNSAEDGGGDGGATNNPDHQDIPDTDTIMEACVDMIRRDAGRSVVFRYTRGDATSEEGIQNVGKISPEKATQMLARVLEGTLKQEQQQQRQRSGTTSTSSVPYSSSSSSMHYYQGLHDIAGVVLHNMDYQEAITTQIMRQISNSHLRDGMRENFGNITWLLSVVLPPLVQRMEPNVYEAIQLSQVDLANICLPWIITWFTHDLHDPDKAARLVDAFLSGHPLLPVYFAVALITHSVLKQGLFDIDYDDPSSAFLLIKKMPMSLSLDYDNGQIKQSEEVQVSIQEILDDSITIMNKIPPRALLDLVDPKQYSRQELLQRASSISLFKAPASWTLASGCFSATGNGWTVTSTTDPMSSDSVFVRAKLASGVPMLMNTTTTTKSSSPTTMASAVLLSPTWGSRRYTKTRRKTKLVKLKRLLRRMVGKKQPAKVKRS